MNRLFLSSRQKVARGIIPALLLCAAAVPVSAQQYRFSAGVHGGAFYASDAYRDKSALRPATAGAHLEYHLSPRWTVGASATYWAEIFLPYLNEQASWYYPTRNGGYPAPYGTISERSRYEFYELYGQYSVLSKGRHNLYAGAGLTFISGVNVVKSDTNLVRMWDNGGEPGPVNVTYRQLGGLVRAGYQYGVGASRHFSLGPELVARAAPDLPLQVYYSISLNYHFNAKSK